MSQRPLPGTWLQLTRGDRPEGKWHVVESSSDDVLELACVKRDRTIAWALDGAGVYAVARRHERPTADLCGRCVRLEQTRRSAFPTLQPMRFAG